MTVIVVGSGWCSGWCYDTEKNITWNEKICVSSKG